MTVLRVWAAKSSMWCYPPKKCSILTGLQATDWIFASPTPAFRYWNLTLTMTACGGGPGVTALWGSQSRHEWGGSLYDSHAQQLACSFLPVRLRPEDGHLDREAGPHQSPALLVLGPRLPASRAGRCTFLWCRCDSSLRRLGHYADHGNE